MTPEQLKEQAERLRKRAREKPTPKPAPIPKGGQKWEGGKKKELSPKMLNARWWDKQVHAKGRLPDGAVFNASYNSSMEQWSGTLDIPGLPPFASVMSGVFRLMCALDTQYRWELDKRQKACQETVAHSQSVSSENPSPEPPSPLSAT